MTYDSIRASILLVLKTLSMHKKWCGEGLLLEDINNLLYVTKHVMRRNLGASIDRYLDFRINSVSRLGIKSPDLSHIFSNMVSNGLIREEETGFQVTRKGLDLLSNCVEGALGRFLKDLEKLLLYLIENFSIKDIQRLAKEFYLADKKNDEERRNRIALKIVSEERT